MIDKEESDILVDMIEEYKIPYNQLLIKTNGTILCGATGEKLESDFIELFKYNHFFESIKDLCLKTKFAIYKGLEECKKIDGDKFDPLSNDISENEFNCYYNLENALYRIEMLWDALAQIYNIYSKMNKPIDKIYYNKFFKEIKKEDKIEVDDILKYMEEKPEADKIDKGVHLYLTKLRNTMTHRYSLSITAFSYNTKEKFVLRECEPELLYKICYEYNKLMKFITDIFNKIYQEQEGTITKYSEQFNKMCEILYNEAQ